MRLSEKEKKAVAELKRLNGSQEFIYFSSFFGAEVVESLYNKGIIAFEGHGSGLLVVLVDGQ